METPNTSSRTVIILVVVGVLIVLLAFFRDKPGSTTPTNTPAPTSTMTRTNTPLPTNTSTTAPTNTPLPSNTAQPTSTPVPTNTPAPINTPVPTNTSAPTSTAPPQPTQPPADTPNPIQNIIWQWTSVTDQSAGQTITVPNPADYTISFYLDGTLSGKADCNTFNGTYSQQNGFSIRIGSSTSAACGEGSFDQQYLKLLNSVASGGSDGSGGLALETSGGAQRLLFRNGGGTVKP